MEERGSWQRKSKRIVYENSWIRIHVDEVIRPDGEEGIYGYLEKPPGVFVIAQDSKGAIYLVQEYRYPVGEQIWQVPGGVMQGENVLANAARELEEETGIRAGKVLHVGTCYVAPGHETTRSEVVLATDLDTSNMRVEGQEGDEDIRSIRRVSQEELDSMVRQGEIKCGITLAALKMLDASRG